MRRYCIIILGLWFCDAALATVYPLKISSSNPRILVDQNNIPFLMTGDSPQSLIANLSATNAAFYVADRATNGFNTLLMDAICTTYTFGRPNADLANGALPFTNTIAGGYYDLTAPNPTYFAYVDGIINLCASNGILVMLDPIETGGWLSTMLANGTTNCRAYGQYLGNRYRNFPNIIWSNGNDFQQWTNQTNDAVVLAVASGIQDYDTNHLQTIELEFYISSSLDDTNWAPIVGLNAAYTYSPTYAEVLHAYNQSSTVPVFVIEANYEYETNSGTDGGSPRILRMQEYWTMLSGATGQLYGNFYSVRFAPGWQNYLDSPGVTQLQYVANLFGSRAWYNLVPDQTHVFVTGGYGQFASSGPIAGNNFVASAITPDGTLGMAYLPQGGSISVAMTRFRNAVSARWFDPSANIFTNIVGSPFPNTNTLIFSSPGTNSAGNPDWVLVLETIKDPPTLNISLTATNTALITWPGGILQQNSDLTTTNWEIVTNSIWVVSNEYQLLISPLVGQQFYRLASNSGTTSLRIFLADTNTAVVAWPGFMLQQNSDLTTTNWINATSMITMVSNEYQVMVSPLLGQQFYRLFSH